MPKLEELRLDNCKKINFEGIFEKCHKVKQLACNGGPDVPSLSFLKQMKSIEVFRFCETNILDGDLTPLLQLKDFGFYPNKKHYSHTSEQLEEIHKTMKKNK